MDTIVSHIQVLSDTPSNWQQLARTLGQQSASLAAHPDALDAALSSLSPSTHTLGFAWLLAARAATLVPSDANANANANTNANGGATNDGGAAASGASTAAPAPASAPATTTTATPATTATTTTATPVTTTTTTPATAATPSTTLTALPPPSAGGGVPPALFEAFFAHVLALVYDGDAAQLTVGDTPRRFVVAVRRAAQLSLAARTPMRCVRVLRAAVTLLQRQHARANQLTALHADLLCAALAAKCYHVGLRALDAHDFDVDARAHSLSSRDIMLYFYYGGMLLCGARRMVDAARFFRHAHSLPALQPSAIAVEAYKKYVLASLLAHGTVRPFAKSMSSHVQSSLRAHASAYTELLRAWSKHAVADVAALVAKHTERFSLDGNLGLVLQCQHALVQRAVQRQTQTFLTLSLAAIAERAHMADPLAAEATVFSMISTGAIRARISHRDGMVAFADDDDHYQSVAAVDALRSRIGAARALAGKLRDTDEQITLSARYLHKTALADTAERGGGARGRRGGGGGGGGGGGDEHMLGAWDSDEFDGDRADMVGMGMRGMGDGAPLRHY